MGLNLLIWKWTPDLDTPAKRKKQGLKYDAVRSGFSGTGTHSAMASNDFATFDRALVTELGKEGVDGPYILWRHPNGRVVDLPHSKIDLVPIIGRLAQKHGLTSAEL